METLKKIQKELKAPKLHENKFGGFMYRSAEDILESVRPMLGDAILTLSDEIVLIGDRYYVKAIALFTEGESSVSVCGWAREGQDKKGMDVAQVTGACSSYARKYALNGLFLCADPDMDAIENGKDEKQTPKIKEPTLKMPTSADYKKLFKLGEEKTLNTEEVKQLANYFKAGDKMTKAEIDDMIENFDIKLEVYLDYLENQKKAD